ncbi:MAG TPA: DUF4249 domain-containing protein [Bacteroidales bacterium]
MNSKLLFLFVFLTVIVNACVDRYYPEIDKYNDTLAIDGLITTDPGPYFIKLQLASTIYHPVLNPLSNAEVSVADDLGNIEFFEETEPGVYSSTSPDFRGIAGRSYQLTVTLSENNIYQSSWEKISAPLGIDSVYAELENHIDPNVPYSLSGYQFYVDTKEASTDTTFLLWRLQSTYKYNSDYKCWHVYVGKIELFPKPDSLFTCWKTEMVPEIIVGTTKSSYGNQLKRYPLHYVSGEGRELTLRYSVLVNQLVVSGTVYNYWKSIRDQNEIQGTLYTQQPYQIRGNIVNINNPEEPVIGCFTAAGIAKKRVYYNSPDIDYNYEICIVHEADYENMRNLRGSSPTEWPIYLSMDENHIKFYPEQRCIDCRERGGQLEKPDFWIDN